MARPTLTPSSNTSKVILTSTGSIATAETATNYAFGIYADTSSDLYDVNFVSGAVDQVAYTYKKLGEMFLILSLLLAMCMLPMKKLF